MVAKSIGSIANPPATRPPSAPAGHRLAFAIHKFRLLFKNFIEGAAIGASGGRQMNMKASKKSTAVVAVDIPNQISGRSSSITRI